MLYLRNPVRIRAQGEFWGGMFCLLGVVIFAARLSQEYGLGKPPRRAYARLAQPPPLRVVGVCDSGPPLRGQLMGEAGWWA